MEEKKEETEKEGVELELTEMDEKQLKTEWQSIKSELTKYGIGGEPSTDDQESRQKLLADLKEEIKEAVEIEKQETLIGKPPVR